MSYSEQIKQRRTEVQTLHNQAKALHADLETRVGKLDGLKDDARQQAERDIQADQTKLDNLITDGKSKRADLDRLLVLEDHEQLLNRPDGEAKAREQRYAPTGRKSWGELVVGSEEFKQATKGSTAQPPRMDRVNVKAISSLDGSAGALVQSQRLADPIDVPHRPRSILDLINNAETTSDVVEYARLVSRTNNAAPAPETQGGAFGLKPESDMTWDLATANVKTIATWIPASRRILQDAPRLRNMVDVDLTEMVRVALENQILSGDGTGENFLGILNTPGILARTQGTGARADAGDTVADTIRRGVTDVMLQFYTPNGVLLNPTDMEAIELEKDTTGQYVRVMDPATGRIWRVAATETAAIAAKQGLVGDLMMAATIWDRMQTEIRVGEPSDFFLRNAVALLAELRAAFAVVRPRAVEKLTFA